MNFESDVLLAIRPPSIKRNTVSTIQGRDHLEAKLNVLIQKRKNILEIIKNIYYKETIPIITYSKKNKKYGIDILEHIFSKGILYDYFVKLYTCQHLIDGMVGHDDDFIRFVDYVEPSYD